MIFVSVGMHEQPFDRLIVEVDTLKSGNFIQDEVFIQYGYTQYKLKSCSGSQFIPFSEIEKKMKEADVIITHGGIGTIIMALSNQKKPIVVPRLKKYKEAFDDHQVSITKRLMALDFVSAVYDVKDLLRAIQQKYRLEKQNEGKYNHFHFDKLRNKKFSDKLEAVCLELIKKK